MTHLISALLLGRLCRLPIGQARSSRVHEHTVVTAALEQQGVPRAAITALDRLAYLSDRGMGALEYRPPRGPRAQKPTAVHLNEVVSAARQVLSGRIGLDDGETRTAISNLVQISTSAGGARAKATVWWSPATGDMTTRPIEARPDLTPWLLKLDGVGKDGDLGTSRDYTRIEYAYSQMAKACGITMMDTRLIEEHGRSHFITARFDRQRGTKQHIASLCALGYVDFRQLATHDYSQYFNVIDRLGLVETAREQAFLRTAFNVYAANCDDHSKNFAFLLTETGQWELAPAYDLTHAFKPGSNNSQHLMSVNGEFLDISRKDLLALADRYEIGNAKHALNKVRDVVAEWPTYAQTAGVAASEIQKVAKSIRTLSPG